MPPKRSDDHVAVEMPPNPTFNQLPSFYKFIFPSTQEHPVSISIPSKIPILAEEMEKKRGIASLTTGKGKWHVKLLENEDGLIYFDEDGWRLFRQENFFNISDVVMLTYHGDLNFSVAAYNSAGALISHVKTNPDIE